MAKKVLVPNLPTRWDAATQKRVPSIDLNAAAQYGKLVCVTQGRAAPQDVGAQLVLVEEAVDAMTADDLLLLTGDPLIMAATLAHAWDRFGTISVLRWDNQRKNYDQIEVKLWTD